MSSCRFQGTLLGSYMIHPAGRRDRNRFGHLVAVVRHPLSPYQLQPLLLPLLRAPADELPEFPLKLPLCQVLKEDA